MKSNWWFSHSPNLVGPYKIDKPLSNTSRTYSLVWVPVLTEQWGPHITDTPTRITCASLLFLLLPTINTSTDFPHTFYFMTLFYPWFVKCGVRKITNNPSLYQVFKSSRPSGLGLLKKLGILRLIIIVTNVRVIMVVSRGVSITIEGDC